MCTNKVSTYMKFLIVRHGCHQPHHHHLQVHFQLLEVEELVQDVDHHLGYLRVRFRISGFNNKCDTVQDAPSWLRTPFKTDPSSIPWLAKLTCAANSLSRWEFVVSICFSASQQLDQRHVLSQPWCFLIWWWMSKVHLECQMLKQGGGNELLYGNEAS